MIISDNDHVTIQGSTTDLIYDFNVIVQDFLKVSPAIVAITLAKRSEEIEQAFTNHPMSKNPKVIDVMDELIECAIEALKAEGGEDNDSLL